jgi:abortive infection bacteriophage resistance protein
MSEVISQHFGVNHKQYLSPKFYRDFKVYNKDGKQELQEYTTCKRRIEQKIKNEQGQRPIKVYLTEYGAIPFWSLSNILSFGDVNSLLSHMKVEYQSRVAKFWGFDHPFLISAMGIMRMFRNACAHNETIYNYKTFGYRLNAISIRNFLAIFNINRDKYDRYVSGTNDILAIFLIFKKMLSPTHLNEFMSQYFSIFNALSKAKINPISMQKIIDELNLPLDIQKLKNL